MKTIRLLVLAAAFAIFLSRLMLAVGPASAVQVPSVAPSASPSESPSPPPPSPSPSPVIVTVPGPVVTITKVVTTTVTVVAPIKSSAVQEPVVTVTPDFIDTSDSQPVSGGSDESYLMTWLFGIAAAAGAGLVIAGIIGVIVRRRKYRGTHAAKRDYDTQMTSEYSVGDYRPEPGFSLDDTEDDVFLELGGQPPEDDTDTKRLPPVI